ncbi:MAG: hypothetical protein SFU83_05065 [Meiothermus sp.]|nr:hypothetical protein [Meiothermus sp.]
MIPQQVLDRKGTVRLVSATREHTNRPLDPLSVVNLGPGMAIITGFGFRFGDKPIVVEQYLELQPGAAQELPAFGTWQGALSEEQYKLFVHAQRDTDIGSHALYLVRVEVGDGVVELVASCRIRGDEDRLWPVSE